MRCLLWPTSFNQGRRSSSASFEELSVVYPQKVGKKQLWYHSIKRVTKNHENYRGISLLDTGYKIYASITKNKLTKFYENLIGEEQN
jgi:hypothetical protein